ncbi:GAF sensor signal transduction histidine kinase [Formosa agariphila KMM 3901]|uniref:histidine kinase n=1 Tax=Formosa agariphila (strain DSM 15362 / KCTC 12365 / LMG 23005 / KMM 3901 / M-2Alg 35-1) TaxID=1347342 RepID=T2KJ12_FORAG|nr:ATP-binding protein [Formosa agariphila]CDF78423.1 GAF sensor signal transduction histidine kinase [Formosa agariphila KMM 3901]
MDQLDQIFRQDVENIAKISIIPNLLDVVCQITGMGFAAVARVTEDKWIACSVKDDIGFGLKPGGELVIETTICNEIRQSGDAVIINHVSEDENFKCHHTPAQYGFQSYISVPILRKDNTFFGTLCAIDPRPNKLNTPEIIGMFNLFVDLISFHLEVVEQLDSSRNSLIKQLGFNDELEKKIKERTLELQYKNEALEKSNKELQEFNHISSHDLQEPLRKIQTFVSRIQESEAKLLSETGLYYFDKVRQSAERMQLLINDLLSYSQSTRKYRKFEMVDLNVILKEVTEDLREEILEKSAIIVADKMCSTKAIPFQLRQLFYNIIGNSLKYSSSQRVPKIEVNSEIIDSNKNKNLPNGKYCHVKFTDNGIGFNQKYSEKIFELFQRLHTKTDFSGTGIGLAIVKKIVENHNGIINVKGSPNTGTEFNIYIPIS